MFACVELLGLAQDNHTSRGHIAEIKRKVVHVHVTITKQQINAEQDHFLGCFKLDPLSTLASVEKQITVSDLESVCRLLFISLIVP